MLDLKVNPRHNFDSESYSCFEDPFFGFRPRSRSLKYFYLFIIYFNLMF